jgi:hypothetical protein
MTGFGPCHGLIMISAIKKRGVSFFILGKKADTHSKQNRDHESKLPD